MAPLGQHQGSPRPHKGGYFQAAAANGAAISVGKGSLSTPLVFLGDGVVSRTALSSGHPRDTPNRSSLGDGVVSRTALSS